MISPGICPPQPSATKFGSSASPRCAVDPEKPLRHPPPRPGAESFCFGRDENRTIPKEEVAGLLLAPQHRVRQRSGQRRRHLRVPHTPRALCPLTRQGDRTPRHSPHTAGSGLQGGAATPAGDRRGLSGKRSERGPPARASGRP